MEMPATDRRRRWAGIPDSPGPTHPGRCGCLASKRMPRKEPATAGVPRPRMRARDDEHPLTARNEEAPNSAQHSVAAAHRSQGGGHVQSGAFDLVVNDVV